MYSHHVGDIINGIGLISTSAVIYKLMEHFSRSLKNRILGPVLYSSSVIAVATLISAAALSIYYSFVPLRESSMGWGLIWYLFVMPLVIFFGILSGFLYKMYKCGSPFRPFVLFSFNVLSVLVLAVGTLYVDDKLGILSCIISIMF